MCIIAANSRKKRAEEAHHMKLLIRLEGTAEPETPMTIYEIRVFFFSQLVSASIFFYPSTVVRSVVDVELQSVRSDQVQTILSVCLAG